MHERETEKVPALLKAILSQGPKQEIQLDNVYDCNYIQRTLFFFLCII